MIETGITEATCIVDLLIESDDGRHIVLAEVREVSLRCVQWVAWRSRET